MTTPSTERKAGPLLGTGAQTAWPFTFKVFAATDIAVTIANSLGVETALVYGVDYSVTLNANQETSPGGTVTYPISGSALPVGSRLVIIGNLPYDQPLDLPAGGNFSPLALENELDRLTMQIQQLREKVGRAVQVSVTADADVILPPPAANELLGWDSTGENLQNFAVSELATAVAYATMRYDTFTGDGTTTQFTLTADPVTLANLDVAISGVTQVPGSDYSLVNGVLVFASAPANGTQILARYGEGLVNVGGDSNDIRYLPAGTGAAQTNVQAKLRQTVSVMDFAGVDPTGVSDSTAGVQAAVTFARAQGGQSRKLYWPRGTYLITDTITLGTNQYIEFDPGVTVNFVPADPLSTMLFKAAGQSEVYLDGNGATLNGTRGTVAGQGLGDAFYIYGSDNVVIRNFVINDFATDGIEITGDNTGSGPCTNVLIENCAVSNCRRNGMSIISVINCTVIGGSYVGTNGALGGPWAGIDVEPNPDCFLENVNIIGVGTGNNDGAGIQFTPGALSPNIGRRFNVNVTGGRSVNDGDLVGVSGLYFANGGALTNKVFGEIVVRGFTVDSPKSRGVNFREWEDNKCPRVVLEDITVYNPDGTGAAVTNTDRSGFVIGLDSTQTATTLGNIYMNNCLAEDTRSPPRMVWGMVAFSHAGKEIKNVTVADPQSINFTASNKFDIYTATAEGPGTSNAFDVSYTRPTLVDLNASQSIAAFGGKRINVTASANNMTLPSASTCNGMAYEIQNAPGVDSTAIVPQAGDTILGVVGVAGASLILDAGGFVRLRSQGSASWTVEELGGLSRVAGMSTRRKIQFHSAAPVAGTWTQGDIVFNSAATIGQPKGWQCTVSGTPGTWVSMGNL